MKNFFSNLTVLGRVVFSLIVVAIIGGAIFGLSKTGVINTDTPTLSFGNGSDDADDYDAVLLTDTYTGWAPIVWGNGGKEGSKNSYFYKKFGIKLKIVQIDDFDGATSYWKEHNNALRFCTLDSYPVESSGDGMDDARYFMIHNFSAGADVIVATKNIKTVADLKGKKIVCSEGTASHSLLLNTLSASGLTNKDVTIITTGYGASVADAFKAGTADAAVVFCPDDDACIKNGPVGTHVLVSTKQINTLVTDGFLAHSKWLDKNPEKAGKIAEALLWANAEMTNNKDTYKEICQVFSKEYDIPLEDVLTVGEKINFATLDDNVNWFGLNTNYKGITGETLYTKMSQVYASINLAKSSLPWRTISEISIVESLMSKNELDNTQTANGTKERTFTAPTKEVQTAEALSNKKVIINFPVDGCTLDADAETIIDREFLSLIKQFNNVYVRIEGNTDAPGSYKYNVTLSQKRAQSVADYLVRMGMDKNRFIVKGNGPDHAIHDGVQGSNQNYRTTDLELIAQ